MFALSARSSNRRLILQFLALYDLLMARNKLEEKNDNTNRRPFLTAEWRDLVILNYKVDSHFLKKWVPVGVDVDDWRGVVYVSLVGFLFKDTKVWGMRFPFHHTFEEINLRFYVRREIGNEVRRGVV